MFYPTADTLDEVEREREREREGEREGERVCVCDDSERPS